jgi:hypothetical protein
MWKDFQKLYISTNGKFEITFAVNNKNCKLEILMAEPNGFGVKLSRLPEFKFDSISASDFIDELKSNGLTSSKINNIDANLEGKGYSLISYSTLSGKNGRGFLFNFGDSTANGFFNENEYNPDDYKADDLFIKGDDYEEELKAREELKSQEDLLNKKKK